MELYNTDTEFHRLVRYIWALAYVPPEHVVPIWESFIQEKVAAGVSLWKKSHGAEIKSFLKYVDSNWIGELNLKTKARKSPAYSRSVWNKHALQLRESTGPIIC